MSSDERYHNLTDHNKNLILDSVNLMIAIIARDHTLSYANNQILEFSKVTFQEIKDLPYWEMPWWQHKQVIQNKLIFAVESAFYGETVRFAATYNNYDQLSHDIDFILKPVIENDEVIFIIAMGYNITDLVKTQKALTRRERQMNAFFKFSSEGYFFYLLEQPLELPDLTDSFISMLMEHQRLNYFNDQVTEILGVYPVLNSSILDIFPQYKSNFLNYWYEMLLNGECLIQIEFNNPTSNEIRYLKINLVAIYTDEGLYEGNFGIITDYTKEALNLKRLEFLASKDPLTHMNNRRSFYSQVISHFENHDIRRLAYSMIMLDIDHFKVVNDTYGHDAGDEVLKEVAYIIDTFLLPHGITCRYGGEEFVAYLNLTDEEIHSKLNLLRLKIENTTIQYAEYQIKVTISIGICKNKDERYSIDALIANADKALYHSKRTGRNRVTIFHELQNFENQT